jgi:hypothetical protein
MMTTRELATVLAALRHWQGLQGMGDNSLHFTEHKALTTEEIDTLCERLNGPCTVYVLFRETNSGDAAGDSDGYIEDIYRTKEEAEAGKLEAIKEAKEEGHTLAWDPDDPDAEEDPDWTVDWRIEEHQL